MATVSYTNVPLSPAMAERIGRTGFVARLNPTGDTIQAYEKLLEKSIDKCGVKMVRGVAEAVITQLMTDINNELKESGNSVVLGDVLRFEVRSKAGLLPNKTTNINKDDLRVVARFLKGKQEFEFALKNTLDGIAVSVYTVTGATEGREVGTFMAGENVRINGKNLKLLEGDFVEAKATVGETEIGGRCVIVESAADHIVVTPPTDIATVPADTEVRFIVTSRGGDEEEGQQEVSGKAKILAYSGNPIIAYFEQAGKERNEFGVDANAIVTIKGAGFTRPNIISAKFGKLEAGGNSFAYAFNPTAITVIDANTVTCKVSAAEDPDQTDEQLSADSAAGLIVLRAFTQMTKSNDLVARYVA